MALRVTLTISYRMFPAYWGTTAKTRFGICFLLINRFLRTWLTADSTQAATKVAECQGEPFRTRLPLSSELKSLEVATVFLSYKHESPEI
jgi:hypothetical protein